LKTPKAESHKKKKKQIVSRSVFALVGLLTLILSLQILFVCCFWFV